MSRYKTILTVLIVGMGGSIALAQGAPGQRGTPDVVDLSESGDAASLAQAIAGPTTSNLQFFTYVGADVAAGNFSMFDGYGITDGVIMSTGNADSILPTGGLNNFSAIGQVLGEAGDGNLEGLITGDTFDSAQLQFSFQCNDKVSSPVQFQFVFASEEYNELGDQADLGDDLFGAFLNGNNMAVVQNPLSRVAVSTINCDSPYSPATAPFGSHCELFKNNDCASLYADLFGPPLGFPCTPPYASEADGMTIVLTATGTANPGLNTLKVAIADEGDAGLNSWVLIKQDSLECGPLYGACCNGEVCIDDVDEASCDAMGNVRLGYDLPFTFYAGLSCDDLGPPCGTGGACCLPGGTCDCAVISERQCEDSSGVYHGDDTICTVNTCNPLPEIELDGPYTVECEFASEYLEVSATIMPVASCDGEVEIEWTTNCPGAYVVRRIAADPIDPTRGFEELLDLDDALIVFDEDCHCGTECSVTLTVSDGTKSASKSTGITLVDSSPPSQNGRGSLLFWPDVEVKFDEAGRLVMDTFLELTNDTDHNVFVQLYFVNGDDPLEAVISNNPPFPELEREHPGWNFLDTQIFLTAHQSDYWSAGTGDNNGASTLAVVPFPNLDPDETTPGRPDPDGNLRTVRGVVIGWAADIDGLEIKHNALSGSALKVDYQKDAAWEYDALVYKRLNMTPGDLRLPMDGREYEPSPARLLLDFYAVGAQIRSGGGAPDALVMDTDLTLHTPTFDFRANGGPVSTYAQADIWNQNEIRFSGAFRCLTCWDQTLLSNFQQGVAAESNNFHLATLQTDKGTAHITGFATGCPDTFESVIATPLLGVQVKLLSLPGSGAMLYGGSALGWDGSDPSAEIHGRAIAGVGEPPTSEID